jgi:hypothetical protein
MRTEWAEVSAARTAGCGGKGESAHPLNCGYLCRPSGSVSLLKAMVVATKAVATHAMTIDATAQAERALAYSRSVMVCKIAAGMLSKTRSPILPVIIAIFGSMGAPGSCFKFAPCANRHISTAGLRQVSTKKSSCSTASLPRCLVMTTAVSACGPTKEVTLAC